MWDENKSPLSHICSVCLEAESVYKCPACGCGTCSLTCSRRHKIRSSCSGIRDPTTFVKRAKLKTSEFSLGSDFNFLEDIQRKVDKAGEKSDSIEREREGSFERT